MSARAWAFAAAAALILAAAPAAAARIAITQVGAAPATQKITLDDAMGSALVIDFADHASGKVDVYPLDSTAESRAANTCRLDVTASKTTIPLPSPSGAPEACQKFAAAVQRGEAAKYAVSPAGGLTYAILEIAPPPAKIGDLPTDVVVKRTAGDAPDWSTAKLPAYAVPAGAPPECHLLLGKWYDIPCSGGTIQPRAAQKKAIEDAFDQGKALTLYARVATAAAPAGEWRAFPFTLAAKADKTSPSPPSLIDRCDGAAVKSASSATEPFYFICVDAFVDRRGVVALECDPKGSAGKPECHAVGDVVRVRRGFTVQAWYAPGTFADISFGGAAGSDAPIFDPSKVAAGLPAVGPVAAAAADYQLTARTYGPRKAGTPAKLSVSVQRTKKEDGSLADYFKVEQEFTVEAYYRGVIRLGFGYTYMPWARMVGIQTTRTGQRYAAVTQSGLSDYELVAGFSYFLCDMPGNDIKPCGALGARVGVLGANATVKVATSLMAGAEIAVGTDLSLGLYGGVHTHDFPDAAYTPGKLVRADVTKVETHFGLTPAFGLVVNFTPSVLKSVGLSQ